MLNSANMYPWYRDSMSQLGQFCSAGTNLPAPTAAHIKTENGYNDCMLALDYAQNKVSRTLFDFHLSLLRRSPINAVSKIRQSHNGFFKPTILPKNERTNLFVLPNSTMIELFHSFFGGIRE